MEKNQKKKKKNQICGVFYKKNTIKNHKEMPELFFIILFSTWYFRTYCDEIILLIWHNLQQTWWFQLESFEPLLVIFSFTFFIGLFNFFDLIVRVHGMSDDLHEEKPSLLNYIGRWLNQYRVEPHILPLSEINPGRLHFTLNVKKG